MRWRGNVLAAATVAALAACGSAVQHQPPAPNTTQRPELAAGQQGSRADVPWGRVGAH